MYSINTSHSIFVAEMVSASTHSEAQRTITQEVYKIATSTPEQPVQRDMTLKIVTRYVPGITNSLNNENQQNTEIGNSSN